MRRWSRGPEGPRVGTPKQEEAETVGVAPAATVRSKRRSPAPYLALFQPSLLRVVLEHPELHGQTYRVLWYLLGQVGYGNTLPLTYEVGEALGLQQSTISKAYRELREAGVIIKHRTKYSLSPEVGWKGDEAAYLEHVGSPR